jgi:hypothetical protein
MSSTASRLVLSRVLLRFVFHRCATVGTPLAAGLGRRCRTAAGRSSAPALPTSPPQASSARARDRGAGRLPCSLTAARSR